MELTEVQVDYALIDRLQRMKNGANVHKINQFLQVYLGYMEMIETAIGSNDADRYFRLVSELDGVTQEIVAYIRNYYLPVK